MSQKFLRSLGGDIAPSRSPSSCLDRLSGMLTRREKSGVEAEARCYEADAKDVA